MDEDTIAAIGTAPGEGGIAVIRISGPRSAPVASAVFRPKSGGNVNQFSGYTVHYGVISNGDREPVVDDGLLTVFRAPRSYTGEDVCEIACHGGSATTGIVLDMVLRAGARLANPGEFTYRAFLNGRMDLSQAEAVADLVRARTESARRLARRQIEGDVSRATAAIRDDLIGIVAAIEVTIDFSDEVGDLQYPEIIDRLQSASRSVHQLLISARKGRILREGLNVAIVGRPNVGKSTLLNALLRSERAIVTPVPGTTRDTIQESVAIQGIPVVLTDTAGIRETFDEVERIGVERAKESIIGSDISLLVLDASAGVLRDDILLARTICNARETETRGNGARKCIVVWNKRDLIDKGALDLLLVSSPSLLGLAGERTVTSSASNGAGIEEIEEVLVEAYAGHRDAAILSISPADPISSVVVSNIRHQQALEAAGMSLAHAEQSALDQMPGDFIAIDVRGALDALGQITGETVAEDIIHRIFKDFCVGK